MDCEPGGGVVCVTCFVRRAHAAGVDQHIWWVVPTPPDMDPLPPPNGRVTPTFHRFVGPPGELVKQWYASYENCTGKWKRWPR